MATAPAVPVAVIANSLMKASSCASLTAVLFVSNKVPFRRRSHLDPSNLRHIWTSRFSRCDAEPDLPSCCLGGVRRAPLRPICGLAPISEQCYHGRWKGAPLASVQTWLFWLHPDVLHCQTTYWLCPQVINIDQDGIFDASKLSNKVSRPPAQLHGPGWALGAVWRSMTRSGTCPDWFVCGRRSRP